VKKLFLFNPVVRFSSIKSSLSSYISLLVFSLCIGLFAGNALSKTTQELIEDAKKYTEKRELNAAVIQLKNAVQGDPNSAEARLELGKLYIEIGDPLSAEKELTKAKSLGAKASEWSIPLAKTYLSIRKAKELLDTIKADPTFSKSDQAQILAFRGDAHVLLGEFPKAEDLYKKALSLDSSVAGAYVGLALVELGKENKKAAGKHLEKALSVDRTHVQAWILKAKLAILEARIDDAEKAFGTALDQQGNNFEAKLGLVGIFASKGRLKEARNHLDPVSKRVPNHPRINYLWAVIHYKEKKFDQAKTYLDKVLNIADDHPGSLLLMGEVQYRMKNFEQAIDVLYKYNGLRPESVPGVKLLAASLLAKREFKEVIKVLGKFEKREDIDTHILGMLGAAYLRTGEAAKATAYLEKAARANPEQAMIQTELGLGRIVSGESEAGIETLETASDLGRDYIEADVYLIITHLRNGNAKGAIKAANNLVKKKKNEPMSYVLRGNVYLGTSDKAKAKKDFEQALQLDKNFTPARLNLAKIAISEKKYSDAEDQYNKVLGYAKDNEDALLGRMQIAALKGDKDAVEKWLTQAQEANQDSVRSSVAMSRFYLAQKNPEQALRTLKGAIKKNPKHPALIDMEGTVYMAMKDYGQAISRFKKLVELYPRSSKGYLNYARVLLATGKQNDAIKQAKKAIEIKDDYIPAYLLLGESYLKAKNPKMAYKTADELKAKFEKLSYGWELEGDIAGQQKDFARAVTAYSKAQGKAPQSRVEQKVALMRKAQGKTKSVIAGLEKWVKENPGDTALKMMLATELQLSSQDSRARTIYEDVVKENPDNIVALNNLSWLYTKKGDKKAIELGKRAYELSQNNPGIADTYGWALVKLGDKSEGLVLLQQARSQLKQEGSIWFHLAYAYYANNRKDEARRELQLLLKSKVKFDDLNEAKALEAKLKQ